MSTSIFRRKEKTHPNDLVVEFKQTGTDGNGNPVYAEVLALEPLSIGGGGAASAVTVVDGGDVAQGSTADAAWVSGSGTVISLLKKIASAGGSAVSIADGADAAQGTTTDAASANTLVGLLKAIKAAVQGTLTTSVSNFPATQPVSGSVSVSNLPATQPVSGSVSVSNFPATQPISGSVTADTELPGAVALSDNVANPTAPMVGGGTMVWDSTLNAGVGGWSRAPGSVTAGLKVQSAQLPAALVGGRLSVDASGVAVPVTGTFFQGTQPVSMATQTPDVTDRAARLLGHVTVDNASLPVTGTFFQATQPVSVAATLNDNLAQVGGTAIAAKALPTNADGQVALPVYVNAQQYATYDVAARNIVTGALTTNTAKAVLSLEHALASTKTVRIRRIMIHALQTTALAGAFDVQITRGTAASSAGTAVVPQQRRLTDPAAEVVVKSLPTIVAASVADNIPAGGFAATTSLYSPPVLIYDWQEAGETKPYMLVAGALQSLVINIISVQLLNLTLTVSVDLTEE